MAKALGSFVIALLFVIGAWLLGSSLSVRLGVPFIITFLLALALLGWGAAQGD